MNALKRSSHLHPPPRARLPIERWKPGQTIGDFLRELMRSGYHILRTPDGWLVTRDH